MCRVHQFCIKTYPVGNVPPERFQNQGTASGTQGGAVLFAPPSKSYRFSHPPSPCAQKHGHGDFAVCGQRLRGHVPSKNTSPTVLSWISLTGATVLESFRFRTICFVYHLQYTKRDMDRTMSLCFSHCDIAPLLNPLWFPLWNPPPDRGEHPAHWGR